MRKENLSIKVPVVDKNGVNREFVFRKGKPVGEGMPNSFCERNCELYTICERVKSPVAVEDPKEDTLQIWCAQQDFDSSYYPHNIIQEMPELFEGEVCEKCKIPGNDFCMVSRLITNKIKNRDESEE